MFFIRKRKKIIQILKNLQSSLIFFFAYRIQICLNPFGYRLRYFYVIYNINFNADGNLKLWHEMSRKLKYFLIVRRNSSFFCINLATWIIVIRFPGCGFIVCKVGLIWFLNCHCWGEDKSSCLRFTELWQFLLELKLVHL